MFGFSSVKVFTTTGSESLADNVCQSLQSRLPSHLRAGDKLNLSKADVERFSNENLQVQVENVRRHFAVIIHTQVPPVNDRLIEFFALLDAINLESSSIEKFIITDSIPHDPNILPDKFKVLSVAALLAEAIKRAVLGQSLTELHQLENVSIYG